MKTLTSQARVLAAVATLEGNRAEANALLRTHHAVTSTGAMGAFPRSRTFRWLLSHPVGRWITSAVMIAVVSRIPLASNTVPRLLRGKD